MRRIVIPVMLLVVGCQPATMELSEEDVATIRALGPAISEAALAQDIDALLEPFTDDAVFMPPNTPTIQGRGSAASWIESAWVGVDIAEHAIELTDVEGAGDFAAARGVYREAYILEGTPEPIRFTGKLCFLLSKQSDGSWRITAEIWNSDVPLPSAEGEHTEGEDRS